MTNFLKFDNYYILVVSWAMNFKPIIKLSAIFYVILHTIKDGFFLISSPFGIAQGNPFSLFLLPVFFFTILNAQEFNTLGDLGNNYERNIVDVQILVAEILSSDEINHLLFWASDLNMDDEINIIDILIEIDIILGITYYPFCYSNNCNCPSDPQSCCFCGEYFIWEYEDLDFVGGGVREVIHFGRDDIWIAGDITGASEYMVENILRWDGESWEIQAWEGFYNTGYGLIPVIPTIVDIVGTSSNNVWFLSGSCTIYNWNGFQVTVLTDCSHLLGTSSTPFWISPSGKMYSTYLDESLSIYDGENLQIIPLISPDEELPILFKDNWYMGIR
jgi:hypothetical protein